MRSWLVFLGLACMLVFTLVGCTTQLTAAGAKITTVSEQQRDCCCKVIDLVAKQCSVGWSMADDTENAMKSVRNEAARRGGNAIRIVDVETNESGSVVTVEVLHCEEEQASE